MHEILKNVILERNYKLADMQRKIKKLYAAGDIDEAQVDELLALAMENPTPETERPELLRMLTDLSARLDELAARIAALEGEGGATEPIGYEDWKPWDGISGQYQNGAIVRHNEKLWISVHPGQNVWEPGTVGTERAWREYAPEGVE